MRIYTTSKGLEVTEMSWTEYREKKKRKMETRLFEKAFKLPFKGDNLEMYVFDSMCNMVFMNCSDENNMQQGIVDCINGKSYLGLNNLSYDHLSGFISQDDRYLLMIRGWGHLTGIGGLNLPAHDAVLIQDDLAAYIIEKLTAVAL